MLPTGGDSIRWGQLLHLFQKSESIPSINSKTNKIILYSRESSQVNPQQGDSTHGFQFANDPETTINPVGQDVGSFIPGLNRTLFIVVVVSSAVVLGLAVFIPVCCWRRRQRRNRRRRRNTPPAEEEEDLELPSPREKDPPKQIYDAPRPDSTTLPIHGILVRTPTRGPPARRTIGSPLGNMLDNFNGEVSTKQACSGPPNYQNWSRSRSNLGPASLPPAVLRFPTIASSPKGNFRSPFFSSGSRTVVQFPTIASLTSNSAPVMRGGAQAMETPKLALKASPTGRKLQKKSRLKFEEIPEPKPITPFPAISTFGGFGRASVAESMSNYWASWWESSSIAEECDPMVKKIDGGYEGL